MPDDRLSNLPLREKLKDIEKLTRELIDHLRRGFIPRSQSLRRLARRGNQPASRDSVSDVAVRAAVAAALQSDEYTQQLCTKTRDYLRSIQSEVEDMYNT
jgi:hypothetical protein